MVVVLARVVLLVVVVGAVAVVVVVVVVVAGVIVVVVVVVIVVAVVVVVVVVAGERLGFVGAQWTRKREAVEAGEWWMAGRATGRTSTQSWRGCSEHACGGGVAADGHGKGMGVVRW